MDGIEIGWSTDHLEAASERSVPSASIQWLTQLCERVLTLVVLPGGSDEVLRKERLLLLTTLMKTAACPFWYGALFAVGADLAALAPLGYQILALGSIGWYLKSKNFAAFRLRQEILILLGPIWVHMALGGFVASSGVILWAFLAPLIAILFHGARQSLFWFLGLLVVILGLALIDPLLAPLTPAIPQWATLAFFVMNFGVVTAIVYVAIRYYATLLDAENAEAIRLNQRLTRRQEELRTARDAAESAYRELKATQASLIQAEKMASLGQLTAGIAHEIKNPLNFVNNFASVSVELLEDLKQAAAPALATLDAEQRADVDELARTLSNNLEKVNQHGRRADGIVRSMLEHSRGTSGERRMVDLNTLVDEALNLAYHGARAQDQSFNITLERDFGAGVAPIEVNPQDMTRVFLNIFSNGFYAATRRARNGSDAGFMPTLKVTTCNAGDAVGIRVRDNGTGIPADIRDKLFQPFFTTKPTGEGTGLGLSITYDIVTQQHGGSIAVDSSVGEYSEFTIRLPCCPQAPMSE